MIAFRDGCTRVHGCTGVQQHDTEASPSALLMSFVCAHQVAATVGITLEKLHLLNKVDRLPNSTSAPAGGGGNEDAPTLEDTLVDGHDDSPDDIAIQV